MPAEKVEILTDNGTTVKAIAPVIISASRSTDIPAYFPKWFATRFNGGRGYVKWFNPFNQKPVFVSFEKPKSSFLDQESEAFDSVSSAT